MKKKILSLLLTIITVAALALPNAGSVMAASYKTFKYEMYDWDADKNVTYSYTWKYESKTQSLYFSKGDVPAAYDAESQNHPWAKYMNQVKKILIGKDVTKSSDMALFKEYCPALTDFWVHADNPYYAAKDGVLYNKKMTEILAIPASWGRKTFTIPKNMVFTEEPWYAGLHWVNQHFPNTVEAFQVEAGNKYFTAKDGVLYDKKMTRILYYPMSKKDSVYTVPKTVKIAPHIMNVPRLGFPYAVREFKVEKGNKYHSVKDGVLYDKSGSTLVYYPLGKKEIVYRVPENITYAPCFDLGTVIPQYMRYYYLESDKKYYYVSPGDEFAEEAAIKKCTPSKVSKLKVTSSGNDITLEWKVANWKAVDGFMIYRYNEKTKKYEVLKATSEYLCKYSSGEDLASETLNEWSGASPVFRTLYNQKAKYAVASFTVQKDGSVKYSKKTTFTYTPKK